MCDKMRLTLAYKPRFLAFWSYSQNHTSRQDQSFGRYQMSFLNYLQLISQADTRKAVGFLSSECPELTWVWWMAGKMLAIYPFLTVSCKDGKTQPQKQLNKKRSMSKLILHRRSYRHTKLSLTGIYNHLFGSMSSGDTRVTQNKVTLDIML